MVSYLPNLLVPDTALSVAGVNAYIQALLEQDTQLRHLWVTGEVSSVNQHRRGLFFTLQDPDVQASIHCVVWTSYLNKLVTVPQLGEQIVVLGRVNLYAARGQVQLAVWQVLPGGEGLRSLRYRQLRGRLEAEGLFDSAHKKPLPVHPQTIAVVTSPQAAAWGDIQRTLRRRYPGLRVLFSPAVVQGDQAPASIVKAIQRVANHGNAEALIVSRGGGATEDMSCFNDERVVRAIAECPIPVIAGIGHQRDESLTDLAADVCAHTPTAAAAQAVPLLSDLLLEHQDRVLALQAAMEHSLDQGEEAIASLGNRLRRASPERQLNQEIQALSWLKQRLQQSTRYRLQQATQKSETLAAKLAVLDPAAALQRGYAVVRQAQGTTQGTIVRQAHTVKTGELIDIQLHQGAVQAVVTEVYPDTTGSDLN